METWVEPAGSVHADLEHSRAAFLAALRVGDASAAAEVYTLDATLVVPAGELLHGRPAIERFWRTGMEIGIGDVELEVLEVRLRGDIAVEVGEYVLHVAREAGAQEVNRGRYLVVHRAEPDGRWCRAAEIFSPDHALGAPPG